MQRTVLQCRFCSPSPIYICITGVPYCNVDFASPIYLYMHNWCQQVLDLKYT